MPAESKASNQVSLECDVCYVHKGKGLPPGNLLIIEAPQTQREHYPNNNNHAHPGELNSITHSRAPSVLLDYDILGLVS